MIKKTQVSNISEKPKNRAVGLPGKPVKNFNKTDYLTKRSLVAKFHESQELIEKTIKTLRVHKISFNVNGHRSPVVMDKYSDTPRVHPMALDIFKEYLEKQKAKL